MGDDAWFYDDAVSVYLAQVRQIPALKAGMRRSVVSGTFRPDMMHATAAGKRLMEANLLLVVSIAERYRTATAPWLDLIQQGNAGLMLAIRSLAESSEDGFSEHATRYIERAIAGKGGPSDRREPNQ